MGLLLIGVVATVMAVTVNRMARAERRLAENRSAARAAERVMVGMQAGRPMQPLGEGESVGVKRVEGETGERVWVRVEATVAGRSAVLYGLVSAAAADEAAKVYGEGRP